MSGTAAEKTAKINQKNCWQEHIDVIIYYGCRKIVKSSKRTRKNKLKKLLTTNDICDKVIKVACDKQRQRTLTIEQ